MSNQSGAAGAWRRHGRRLALAGAALAALLAAGAWQAGWLKPGQAAAAPAGEPAKSEQPAALQFAAHEVVLPQPALLAGELEFSGPLVAPRTATLRSRSAGTLQALAVEEGQRVQAGQLLGRVEPAEMDSRLAERAAQLQAARAALAQAERTHANDRQLAQQQFISANALESSRLALQAATAQAAAAAAALESVQAQQRETRLLAPISGIVARRHALPGERVAPDQPVLTVVDLARLELAGLVGTHEVARLAPGMPVQLRVEGLPEALPARIARIAPAAEPGTRAIGVAVVIANPGERLRAGQYAVARVRLAPEAGQTEQLTLPLAAVAQAHGQDHVWLIEQGRLQRRAVQLGRRDAASGRVEVLQGLQPGSQVLAARFDQLREGAEASVVAPPVTASAAATGTPAATVAN